MGVWLGLVLVQGYSRVNVPRFSAHHHLHCRWINNAGQVTPRRPLHELQPQDIASAVGCNVLGSLLCCRAAITLMKQHHDQQQQQQQQGAVAELQEPLYHIFK